MNFSRMDFFQSVLIGMATILGEDRSNHDPARGKARTLGPIGWQGCAFLQPSIVPGFHTTYDIE